METIQMIEHVQEDHHVHYKHGSTTYTRTADLLRCERELYLPDKKFDAAEEAKGSPFDLSAMLKRNKPYIDAFFRGEDEPPRKMRRIGSDGSASCSD